MDAWMGSHFTNDDLIKESRLLDDYLFTPTFSGVRDGLSIEEITLIPKPDAATVWGKIILAIRTEDEMPLSEVYYNDEMKPIRILYFSDVKRFGTRMIPANLKMTMIDKPDEYTELIYESMAFDVPLDDGFFSLSHLRGP